MKAIEAYQMGKDRGYSIASWQDMPEMGTEIRPFTLPDFIGTVKTIEDAADVFSQMCYQAESNDREYSPFEFTASEFNKARNSERLWEEFDRGICDGISENWNSRKSYYDN